jgi:hypothetical protein
MSSVHATAYSVQVEVIGERARCAVAAAVP